MPKVHHGYTKYAPKILDDYTKDAPKIPHGYAIGLLRDYLKATLIQKRC